MFHDIPGNIHYGYIGRKALVPRSILLGQASKVQKGGVDPDHDVVAITIGMDMADNGGTLCQAIQKHAEQLNYGENDYAKKCDKTCDCDFKSLFEF